MEINDKNINMLIVDGDFDMLRIESRKLNEGIIIPQYYAELWDVKTGDTLEINGDAVKIAGIVKQSLNFFVYASRYYAESIINELPEVYNVIFAKTHDLQETENGSSQRTNPLPRYKTVSTRTKKA